MEVLALKSCSRTILAAFLFLAIALVSFQSIPSKAQEVKPQPATVSPVADLPGPPIAFSETSDFVRLNFTMFIIDFYKSGYEVLYAKTGSVLVYYHSAILQYYNEKVNDWRVCGSFVSLAWNRIDSYHYRVEKRFEDPSTSPKTVYTVMYDIRSDSRIKISIRIESGASRHYRLLWSFDGIVYNTWQEKKNTDNVKHRILFGDESKDFGWLAIDWQDIYEQFRADVASYAVSTSAKGRKANLYFDLGAVEAGKTLTIDPSIVGSSTTTYATLYPYQRKTFYAQGRRWVFYSDGSNIVYRTSTDGLTWTSAVTVRSGGFGNGFSIWFDGTYLHYAWAWASSLYYRRGMPNSDGSITWSAPEQTIPFTSVAYPSIAVDSNGYAWICYVDFSNGCPYVIKSGNNDGTWGTTPPQFPYQLATGDYGWQAVVVPLVGGKMFIGYGYRGSTFKAKTWTGSTWNTEVQTSSAIQSGQYIGAIAENDEVHVVFLKATSYDIIYANYSYVSNSFVSEITLKATASSTSAPVIGRNPDTNDLYIFWAGSPSASHIYYRRYLALYKIWTSEMNWLDESSGPLYSNDDLSCAYSSNELLGLIYLTGTSSPYSVKYASMSLNTAPNPPTLSTPASNARFNPNASVTFSWAFSDPDPGDSQSAYQLQIGNTGFATIYLDTGKVVSSSASTARTIPSSVGLYYWRVKVWDSKNAESGWSEARAIIADRLIVSFYATPSGPTAGDEITLSWTIRRQYDLSQASDFRIDITKDGNLWKSNLTTSSVTDKETEAVTHSYNVSEVVDNTYSLTAWTSEGIRISWQGTGGPAGGGGGGGGAVSIPTTGGMPSVSAIPVPPEETRPLINFGLIIIVSIVGVAIAYDQTRPKRLKDKWARERKRRQSKPGVEWKRRDRVARR
jgi:hypothetical protein